MIMNILPFEQGTSSVCKCFYGSTRHGVLICLENFGAGYPLSNCFLVNNVYVISSKTNYYFLNPFCYEVDRH